MPQDSDTQVEATEPEMSSEAPVESEAPAETAESGPASSGSEQASWAPPSREEYERLRQHAEIGAEFAPHAQHIRALIQQGFSPKQAEKEVAKQEQQQVAARHRLHDPKHFREFWANASQNPDTLLDLIDERAREIAKPFEDRFKKYDERFGSLEKRANELHGHAVLTTYQRRAEYPKVEKDFLETLGKGKDPETAWELATLRAQVAAAKAAPAAASAGAAPKAAAKPPIKPAPREDRSAPKPGASRSVATPAPVASVANGSKGAAALRAAAKRLGMSIAG